MIDWFVFTKRFFLQFLLWLGVSLVLDLIGLLVLAVVLPFIVKDAKRLPTWCRWFDSADGYINGDDVYQKENAHWPLFWLRYNWLAIRNPTNYFQVNVLGQTWLGNEYIKVATPNAGKVGDHPEQESGIQYIESVDGIYEYYMVYRLGQYAFKFRMGWKIGYVDRRQRGEVLPWCFSITPFSKI